MKSINKTVRAYNHHENFRLVVITRNFFTFLFVYGFLYIFRFIIDISFTVVPMTFISAIASNMDVTYFR